MFTIELSDLTTTQIDLDEHIRQTYNCNELLVSAMQFSDYDIVNDLQIHGVFGSYNRDELIETIREKVRANILAKMSE